MHPWWLQEKLFSIFLLLLWGGEKSPALVLLSGELLFWLTVLVVSLTACSKLLVVLDLLVGVVELVWL